MERVGGLHVNAVNRDRKLNRVSLNKDLQFFRLLLIRLAAEGYKQTKFIRQLLTQLLLSS
ncbi:MAG: hypothetical protein BGO21_16205 [Dyadobacter sp. 50-39]|nr:MAG: hypothetical protein BGO21_16205 [Dyadobacter sp. 50-39]